MRPSAKKIEAARQKWEKLQAEFRKRSGEIEECDRELALKYGRGHLMWASRGERAQIEKEKRQRDRVQEKIYAMAETLSPRNWLSGVLAFWVASSLTFDDLIRPLGEPLSVVPPLAYGASSPIQ